MFTPVLLGRGRWLCATLAAAAIASLPLPAQALNPATPLARHQLQREGLLPADPGMPRAGAHLAKVGVPPALLPPRRADDFVPHRLAIGETTAEAKLVPSPRAKAARAKRLTPTGASCTGVQVDFFDDVSQNQTIVSSSFTLKKSTTVNMDDILSKTGAERTTAIINACAQVRAANCPSGETCVDLTP